MAKLCSKNNNLVHRTCYSFKYIYIFVCACTIVTSEVGAHIDFDDIELAWLKNVTVNWLPVEKNQRQNCLQIVGLPPMDNEDDLKIRPTFSAIDCVSNETNLQILNNIPTADNRSTELIVSLRNFDFKHKPAAYLCIQTKYENFFQHMGIRSKLENLGVDLFNRDRRNPQFESTRSDNLCPMGVLRIIGIRIVSSDKEITTDEEDIPDLVAKYNARLRLYGCGFREETVITFTKKIGGSCQEDLGEYQVIAEGLRDDTALVDIVVPAADVHKYYICVRNMGSEMEEKTNEQAPIFKHQGIEPWRTIRSHDLLLPDWLSIIIMFFCLSLSALFSGLNLGLMSLDRTELKILRNTGNPNERKYAKKIQPVRDHGNYLLCSILLGNVMVNSILTVLLGSLTSGLVAVAGSTILIVIFGEITPQAICSRHGLAVGAKTIILTKAIMVLTFPLAYPVSKILDCILGEEIGNVYDRERLKELVRVTRDINDLDKYEVNIISGALELRKKTVKEVMTPIEDAFMLSMDAILDFNTVTDIMRSGFSRIPVYEGDRNNVVTLLFIKDLALIDTDDKTPLRTVCTFYENACFFVFEDVTLDVVFKDFKEGRKGHMAFVHHVNTEGDGDPFYETIGLVTLEDVIEEMIQAEIIDETDVYTDNRHKMKRSSRDREKVYKVFKGGHQREPISQQLALATYQYLNTAVDAFKTEQISKIILRHLLNQNVFHSLKMRSKDKNDKSNHLYEHGKPADYFVLLLEGRVEVMVGKENLLFEGGPFTYYGTQALSDNVGIVIQTINRTPEKSPNRSQNGSMNSLFKDVIVEYAFIPDFTVRALTDLTYVLIKRSRYLAAKRATAKLEELNAGNVSNEPIDDEVKELLFSFDDGDGSESAHSPNLNAISLRASTTASPTTAHVESPLNDTATHQGEHHQCSTPVVTYAPENHTVQIHTPEQESGETDALLTPQS